MPPGGPILLYVDGLGIGDGFYSAHGLTDGTNVHENVEFVVVGILKHTSSVIDQLLLTNIESIWGVHGDHTEHSEEKPKEITAVLLKKRNPMAVLTLPNLLKETNMKILLAAKQKQNPPEPTIRAD